MSDLSPVSSPSIPNGWNFEDNALKRSFQFANFSEALAFIVRVGLVAESVNHHPIIWNVWNQVKLTLNTHDAGDIVTDKDYKLAQLINNLL